jgi:holo-[acyl-carrier protein] synthase
VIVGVGIDVVDLERFARSLERTPGLAVRLFTEDERRLPPRSLAARFAAKEALAKALGAPRGLRWTGAAARLGVDTWHISLSHDGGVAVAVVIAEHTDGGDRP